MLDEGLLQHLIKESVIHEEGDGDVVEVGVLLVELARGRQRILIASPRTASYTAHDVPSHSLTEDFVYTTATIEDHTKASVDRLTDTDATTVVQSDEAHTTSTVTRKALDSHVGHNVTTVTYIGCLAEGAIRTAHIVVVTTDHDRTNLATTYHIVELKCDLQTARSVLVEDTRLGTDDELILLGVTYPYIVVTILLTTIWVYALHSSVVCLDQILVIVAEAYPAEWTIAVVKELRSHNILYIAWPDEAILVVYAIARDLLNASIKASLHKGITIVKEVSATSHQSLDSLVVTVQTLVHLLAEVLSVVSEQVGALLKGKRYRAVTTLVDSVTARLIGE